MKRILFVSLLVWPGSWLFGQVNSIAIDTCESRGIIIESRYGRKIVKNKKKSFVMDRPLYYVLLDSAQFYQTTFLRSELNKDAMQNDSIRLVFFSKDFKTLNYELFQDTLLKGILKTSNMFECSKEKYRTFKDDSKYFYKVHRLNLKFLRFKVPRNVLYENDILSRYDFSKDFVYFFIVYDGVCFVDY
jgi:hypothetical protein